MASGINLKSTEIGKSMLNMNQILEQLTKQITNSLSMLLNAEISLAGLELSESQILSDSIDLSSQKVLTKISLQDSSLDPLLMIVDTNTASQIACMMMGSKELGEFDSVKLDAYNSALEQAFKEGLKQLELDSNIFSFQSFQSSLIDSSANLDELKSEGAQGIIVSAQVNQNELLSYVEISANLLNALSNGFEPPNAGKNMSEDEKTVGDYLGTSFAEIADTHNPDDVDEKKNLNLLLDIRMGLIVELGRTEMHLKDILKLTKGSIIELDRLSGEAVDLFVNNKLIARGEVVVIDDNFGLRITQLAGAQNNREIELGLVD